MLLRVVILLTSALFLGIEADNLIIDDEEYHIFESNHPYTESDDLSIKCGKGYNIIVLVEKLEVELNDQDYLLIKAGNGLEDDLPGLVFTYTLKSTRQYVIGGNKAYFFFKMNGNNLQNLDGYQLKYKCDGNPTTTTEKTSTTIHLPQSIVDNNFTAYVYTTSFNMDNFRDAVKDMAQNYCKTQNINLQDQITKSNVLINRVDKCPYNWPEERYCIKVKLAIPIILADPNAAYQLRKQDIEIMWNRLGDEYLDKFNMKVYKLFDENDPTKWVVVAAIILLLLTILLILGKYIATTIQIKLSELHNENDQQKQQPEDKRISENLLHPHPFQVIPVEKTGTYFEVNMRRDVNM